MDANEVTLLNVCKGMLPEIFMHAVEKVIANIADPNTSVKEKRAITLEFVATPYPDRSGATFDLKKCKTSLGDLDTSGVSCSVHIAKHDGKFKAFTRDLRQELLFQEEKPPQDGKSAAGGS